MNYLDVCETAKTLGGKTVKLQGNKKDGYRVIIGTHVFNYYRIEYARAQFNFIIANNY